MKKKDRKVKKIKKQDLKKIKGGAHRVTVSEPARLVVVGEKR